MLQEYLAFMRLYFTEEAVREMYNSLLHLEMFKGPTYQPPYEDIINLHQLEHNDGLIDQWSTQIRVDMKDLLESHGIAVVEDAELSFMNKVVNTLVNIMNVDDGTPISIAMEAMKSSEELFSDLIEMFTDIDSANATLNLMIVKDDLIASIKKLAEAKEKQVDVDTFPELIYRLKVYTEFIASVNLAYHLVKDGLLLGQKLSTYLLLTDETFDEQTDDLQYAKDFVSLAIISGDYNTDITLAFKEHSAELLGEDANRVKKIEILISNMAAEFSNRLKVEDEKARLL